MAVVYVRETYRGVGLRMQFNGREVEGSVPRKFLVRVDDFFTDGAAICSAPGVMVGQEHPDLKGWTASEFAVDCEDNNGLMWGVTVTYKMNSREFRDDGLPKDEWSASNGSAMIPATYYIPNPAAPTTYKRMENSAGSPIEGMKKEMGEFTWKLVRAFATASELRAAVAAAGNMVNGSAWGGQAARCWKCDFRSASQKKLETPKRTTAGDPNNENAGADGEMEPKKYWEGVFEFRCQVATWDLKPWDAGFMEKDTAGTGLKAILGADKKPVKEPWKLDGQGHALKADGTPVRLTFPIYPVADFQLLFGSPPM